MARANQARLQIVQFVPVPRMTRTGADGSDGQASPIRFEPIRQSLESVVRTARTRENSGLPYRIEAIATRIETGELVPAVERDIRHLSADLLVLSADPLRLPGSRFVNVLHHGLRKTNLNILVARPIRNGELEQITVCLDSPHWAGPVISHATRLRNLSGASIRLLHPYRMSRLERECWSLVGRTGAAVEEALAQEAVHQFTRRLPPHLSDFNDVDLVCRQVRSRRRVNKLLSIIAEEDTDLLVLPLSHRFLFEATRQTELILEAVSAARSPILILRNRHHRAGL